MIAKPKRYIACIILLFCTSLQIKADNTTEFLSRVLLEIRPVSKQRAFYVTDSIYRNTLNVHHKIHALFIKAYLYHDDFDTPNSINEALKAIELAQNNKSYKWLGRLYGFVAAEYSRLELFQEAFFYFEKIEKTIPKVSDQYDRVFSSYYYQHLLSSYYYLQKDYHKALECIELAEIQLNKITDKLQSPINYLISHQQNKAINYLELKDYKNAQIAYQKAFNYTKESDHFKDFLATGYIYIGLARVEFLLNKDNPSLNILAYYENGLRIANLNNNRELKQNTYYYLSEYFEAIKDIDNYSLYNKSYLSEKQAIEEFKTVTVNQLLEDQYLHTQKINQKNKRYFIIIISVFSFLLVLPLIYYIKMGKNKQKTGFELQENDILYKLTTTKLADLPLLFKSTAWRSQSVYAKDKSLIEFLKHFEENKGFLDTDITLESISKKANCSPEELVNILKQYKNIDFKTYISQYRLLEVITLLRTDKKFRAFKIGHLAKITGFNSHSTFTVEFKRIIGVNPSFFIQYLNEINNKDSL